jgi:hypothetical protein
MVSRHQLSIAFDCEAGKNAKLLEENERLHRQMHSSQPYYYDEWKRLEAVVAERMKDWPDGPPVTQQEWLQSQARIEDALAHYRDGGQSDNLVAIEMVRLLVGKK